MRIHRFVISCSPVVLFYSLNCCCYITFFFDHRTDCEAGVAGGHRDAEIVEAEKYERILGTSFILDGLLFVLDGILGGER